MKRWAALLCTLAIMALIFTLSGQPGPTSDRLSNAALSAVEKSGADAFTPGWFDSRDYANIRKWAHVYLYAALGVSMAVTVHLWLRRPRLTQAALSAGLCFLYAAGDEIHQHFVPERAGMWQDVFVDALGFLPGIALVCLLLRLRRR